MFRSFAIGLLLLSAQSDAQDPVALELSDCRISAGPGAPGIKARCGTFIRPLDPEDSGSTPLRLHVAVVPALSLEPEPEPLVPIAGGPGQSSVSYYAAYAPAFERVRRSREILLLDQRGTGLSATMNCDVDDDIVEGQYSKAQTLLATRECLTALPYDPRYFTTSVAVSDLEALRKALGYSQLNLYGISYGSRVAQHFARRYPESTRTVIIDGVVPPQIALGPEIATESQRAVSKILERCANDVHCGERFPTIRQDFLDIRGQLEDSAAMIRLPNPVTGRIDTVEFGSENLGVAIRLLLYNQRTIALLPLLLHEAANGNYVPLAAQFQMSTAALADALSIGMHNAVACTEDVPFIDDNSVDHEALAASYLGPLQLEALQTMCSIWPAGVLDDDFKEPLSTAIPFLLLSGDADPITPPRYAEMAAVNLSNAWLLTGVNQGHGQAIIGCMPRIIDQFVTVMSFEGIDTDCLEDSYAMPFFLDFSGPAP